MASESDVTWIKRLKHAGYIISSDSYSTNVIAAQRVLLARLAYSTER